MQKCFFKGFVVKESENYRFSMLQYSVNPLTHFGEMPREGRRFASGWQESVSYRPIGFRL